MQGTCETCGNQYHNVMQITCEGETHTFDSFECAIHALAPRCQNCGVRVVGHGVEHDKLIFCSAHCAHAEGHSELKDQTR